MFIKLILGATVVLSLLCSQQATDTSTTFIASTPGDDPIKSILTIPIETKVDFMRWNLVLNSAGSFSLKLAYGESKPNSLGFMETLERSYEGQYTVTKGQTEIYHLKAKGISNELKVAKINDNILHILSSDNQLMLGNGGWSYVLNAEKPVTVNSALKSFELPEQDTARQLVFDGRTPCKEFAKDHGIKVDPSCFKFKWRLILNRDPKTLEPTTYSARRIVYDITDTVGKWAIKKTNGQTVIIQLNPDVPERSISLVMLDDNILYFLDKNGQPYTGNADFSFALNKKY